MSARCDSCRGRIRGAGNHTATRVLCDQCFASFQGAAAGIVAGGDVEHAIATQGWYERIRTAIKKN